MESLNADGNNVIPYSCDVSKNDSCMFSGKELLNSNNESFSSCTIESPVNSNGVSNYSTTAEYGSRELFNRDGIDNNIINNHNQTSITCVYDAPNNSNSVLTDINNERDTHKLENCSYRNNDTQQNSCKDKFGGDVLSNSRNEVLKNSNSGNNMFNSSEQPCLNNLNTMCNTYDNMQIGNSNEVYISSNNESIQNSCSEIQNITSKEILNNNINVQANCSNYHSKTTNASVSGMCTSNAVSAPSQVGVGYDLFCSNNVIPSCSHSENNKHFFRSTSSISTFMNHRNNSMSNDVSNIRSHSSIEICSNYKESLLNDNDIYNKQFSTPKNNSDCNVREIGESFISSGVVLSPENNQTYLQSNNSVDPSLNNDSFSQSSVFSKIAKDDPINTRNITNSINKNCVRSHSSIELETYTIENPFNNNPQKCKNTLFRSNSAIGSLVNNSHNISNNSSNYHHISIESQFLNSISNCNDFMNDDDKKIKTDKFKRNINLKRSNSSLGTPINNSSIRLKNIDSYDCSLPKNINNPKKCNRFRSKSSIGFPVNSNSNFWINNSNNSHSQSSNNLETSSQTMSCGNFNNSINDHYGTKKNLIHSYSSIEACISSRNNRTINSPYNRSHSSIEIGSNHNQSHSEQEYACLNNDKFKNNKDMIYNNGNTGALMGNNCNAWDSNSNYNRSHSSIDVPIRTNHYHFDNVNNYKYNKDKNTINSVNKTLIQEQNNDICKYSHRYPFSSNPDIGSCISNCTYSSSDSKNSQLTSNGKNYNSDLKYSDARKVDIFSNCINDNHKNNNNYFQNNSCDNACLNYHSDSSKIINSCFNEVYTQQSNEYYTTRKNENNILSSSCNDSGMKVTNDNREPTINRNIQCLTASSKEITKNSNSVTNSCSSQIKTICENCMSSTSSCQNCANNTHFNTSNDILLNGDAGYSQNNHVAIPKSIFDTSQNNKQYYRPNSSTIASSRGTTCTFRINENKNLNPTIHNDIKPIASINSNINSAMIKTGIRCKSSIQIRSYSRSDMPCLRRSYKRSHSSNDVCMDINSDNINNNEFSSKHITKNSMHSSSDTLNDEIEDNNVFNENSNDVYSNSSNDIRSSSCNEISAILSNSYNYNQDISQDPFPNRNVILNNTPNNIISGPIQSKGEKVVVKAKGVSNAPPAFDIEKSMQAMNWSPSPTAEDEGPRRSAFMPYKAMLKALSSKSATVLTNLQRGNVQTPQELKKHEYSWFERAGRGSITESDIDGVPDIDATDMNGFTALMWSAAYGHIFTVKLLLKKGANVHIRARRSETAVHLAAAGGHHRVLKHLISYGAGIDLLDDDGNSALIYAVHGDHHHSVQELLKHGATLFYPDCYNYAIVNECPNSKLVIESHIVNLLVGKSSSNTPPPSSTGSLSPEVVSPSPAPASPLSSRDSSAFTSPTQSPSSSISSPTRTPSESPIPSLPTSPTSSQSPSSPSESPSPSPSTPLQSPCASPPLETPSPTPPHSPLPTPPQSPSFSPPLSPSLTPPQSSSSSPLQSPSPSANPTPSPSQSLPSTPSLESSPSSQASSPSVSPVPLQSPVRIMSPVQILSPVLLHSPVKILSPESIRSAIGNVRSPMPKAPLARLQSPVKTTEVPSKFREQSPLIVVSPS